MSQPSAVSSFRTFVIVWATQSISVFGSALTLFAINIWLTQTLYPRPEQRPQLAAALAAFNLAFAVPVIFGAPLAGAWADRHDRKRTMMTANVLNGGISLVLMLLMATQHLQIWMVVVVGALASITGAFHNAAFDTSYALLVSPEQLPRANGMMQTIWSLSGILSPALAAAIIALPALARQGAIAGSVGALLASLKDGVPLAIALDALTFFLAAVILVFLMIPSPKRSDLDIQKGQPIQSFASDIKEGALYIWHRRPLLWLLGTFAVANFIGGLTGLLALLLLKFNLAPDWSAHGFTYETTLALYNSVAAIGGVAGGLLMSIWGGLKTKRVYGVLVPMLLQGIGLLVIGLSPFVFLMIAVDCMLLSATHPILNAHSQAIWQTQTPHILQGRVFSVRRLIAQATWPISTAIAGTIGGFFDPGYTIAILGGLFTLFCVAQLFNRHLRHVENKTALDAMAAQRG